MESQRSNCVESIDRPLGNSLQLPASLRQVLASPDTEIAPQISPSRKYSQPLFSMKAWSDRAKKMSLSRVRPTLEDPRTLYRSNYFFLEKLVHQLAHSWRDPPLLLWNPQTKSLITSPVFVQMTRCENGGYIHVQSIHHQHTYNFPTPFGDRGGSQSCNFGNSVGIEIRCGG